MAVRVAGRIRRSRSGADNSQEEGATLER
jgi:hypothetical protein